jgi:hypothetical protein
MVAYKLLSSMMVLRTDVFVNTNVGGWHKVAIVGLTRRRAG